MVCLDQEKCFNRVDHGFLFKAMAACGFRPAFLSLIRFFYNGGTSRVLVNGSFSEQIRLGCGLKPGDPPSSLLDIITSELVANAVRKDSQIMIRGRVKKIGGYADDTQGYLTTDDPLRRFMAMVKTFGQALGSRLNWEEPEELWLGPWQDRVGGYHGLNWKDKVKMLGV